MGALSNLPGSGLVLKNELPEIGIDTLEEQTAVKSKDFPPQ